MFGALAIAASRRPVRLYGQSTRSAPARRNFDSISSSLTRAARDHDEEVCRIGIDCGHDSFCPLHTRLQEHTVTRGISLHSEISRCSRRFRALRVALHHHERAVIARQFLRDIPPDAPEAADDVVIP